MLLDGLRRSLVGHNSMFSSRPGPGMIKAWLRNGSTTFSEQALVVQKGDSGQDVPEQSNDTHCVRSLGDTQPGLISKELSSSPAAVHSQNAVSKLNV